MNSIQFKGSYWVDRDIITYRSQRTYDAIQNGFKQHEQAIRALPDSVEINYGFGVSYRRPPYIEIAMKPWAYRGFKYKILKPGLKMGDKWWHLPKPETYADFIGRAVAVARGMAKRYPAK